MIGETHPAFRLRRDIVIFAGLAALYVAAEWIIGRMAGPFSADPDYIYLFNGMNILTLRAPMYYDHPGTPVQGLIAIVIAMTWILTLAQHGLSNVKDEVLTHSQFYLECAHWTFVAFNAAALYFFAWRVRRASGEIAPALVGALSLFIFYPVSAAFHRVMPESVLIGATLALAGVIAPAAFSKEQRPETPRLALIVGVMLGFCFTAKVTSVPLLLMIFFFRSHREKLVSACAFGASAVAFTVPIVRHYPEMALFYLKVFTHTGAYGTGGAGAPAWSEILANARTLCSAIPAIYICPALYGAVLLLRSGFGFPVSDNAARLLKFSIAVIVLSFILVVKQPETSHLLPALVFLCLGNAVAVHCLLRNRRYSAWAYAVILVAIARAGFYQTAAFAGTEHQGAQADQALLARVSHSGCLMVPHYTVNQTDWNLFFGNFNSGSFSNGRLLRLYPRAMFYNEAYHKFQTYAGILDREAAVRRLAGEKCVYLAGGQADPSDNFGFGKDAILFVDRSPSIFVYQLKPDWGERAVGDK